MHWILNSGRLNPNVTDCKCTAVIYLFINLYLVSSYTGLHYAAANGYTEVYYCLLRHGADSTRLNNKNENSLDVARQRGKTQHINRAS